MPPKRKRKNPLPTSASSDASSTRYLLKIDSFSLLSDCGTNKYESHFDACGYKWIMTIYPNGDGDRRDHVSVYLGIVGTDSLPANWEVNATVSFLIFDQIHENYVIVRGMQRRFHNIKTEWGLPEFISHANFKEPSNGYLVNDKCIFGVDVYVIKNQLLGDCLSSLNVIQPYKHEWKISEFTKLKNFVFSEEFTSGGYKWQLQLYPTGDNRQNGQNISIFLVSVDAKEFDCQKRILAKYSISVQDQITGAHRKMLSPGAWFTSGANSASGGISSAATKSSAGTKSSSWGWPAYMALSELKDPKKGFLVNDCCIVEAEVSILGVVNGFTKHIVIVD